MKYGTGEDEPSNSGPIIKGQVMDIAGQQGPKAPGTGPDATMMQQGRPLAKSRERIIHAKAVRTVGPRYGVGEREIEFLAALDLFMIMRRKEGIGAIYSQLIDWTGARPNWKKRMREAERNARKNGLTEEIPRRKGRAIDITEKGRRCLEDYCKRFAEVEEVIRAEIRGNGREQA